MGGLFESPVKRSRTVMDTASLLKLHRSNSMSRLFTASSTDYRADIMAVFGNESCTEFVYIPPPSMVVRSSIGDSETSSDILLREVYDAIEEQTKLKNTVDRQLKSSLDLAKARYVGGSNIGAILSMRRAHTNKNMKANIAAARFQLNEIREQLEAEIEYSASGVNVTEWRHRMNQVMLKLDMALRDIANYNHMPSDQNLLNELKTILEQS